jgi:hypothetical protein
MKTKNDLVNNWILKADNDLKSAEHERRRNKGQRRESGLIRMDGS